MIKGDDADQIRCLLNRDNHGHTVQGKESRIDRQTLSAGIRRAGRWISNDRE